MFVSHHIVLSSPAPSPVLKVLLENSKETYIIICYSPHLLAALKYVDRSWVLKSLSHLFFMVSLSNLSVYFCCAHSL